MSSSAAKYDVFQAIADPTRREVLRLLADKEMPISQITRHFPISRTAIAKHLHILTEAELVSGRKVGREKIYRLHPEPLTELKDWLSFYERFWSNKLSILKHVVEQETNPGLRVVEAEEKDRH
ncbi:metalloregulator ArsR/SmtB family transcription factor [Paenibacillus dendritiformis]|uniref:ArsR/SmtB family transcription factor n=1 Tax=Paenibacillus dendritiformis TaxID=130049 RepID=UPI0020C257F4|nr:metalloregulator ArsR/SmtB family transcription factor [Paenibacillus dendritiformis]WGU96500.1 metalloregulator ArsR/SmtB family transcription factor [Paenibacillus dendritiformis]CAH8770342.1 metalloregulator ArsR/SmtB family transcription factor [Paenibacillus dendritiformis]